MIGAVQRVGSAVGIAVIGSVFFGTLVIAGKTPDAVATGFTDAAAAAMAVRAASRCWRSCWCSPCRAARTRVTDRSCEARQVGRAGLVVGGARRPDAGGGCLEQVGEGAQVLGDQGAERR